MENAMSKRNWSDILQAQRDSGLSIEAFCRVKKLARSNFYTARARQISVSGPPYVRGVTRKAYFCYPAHHPNQSGATR